MVETTTSEELVSRIDRMLEEKGKTRYWLSKEATDGKSTRVITDMVRQGTMPKEPRLRRLAEALDTTIDYLMGRTNNPAQTASEVSIGEHRMDWNGPTPGDPGIPLVGTGDCASLTVTNSETGQTVEVERSSFDPEYHVRYIDRPPALRGAREIYAIYYHGDSMEPRFAPGEVGLVDPRRPVAIGDYVVVQLNNGEEDDVVTVLVKRLIRQSSQEVVLEQFNPALTFAIPRHKVARIHRIIPPTGMLFG